MQVVFIEKGYGRRILLWSLTEIHGTCRKAVIYTDSQNIVGLPGRRNHLE